MVMITPPAIAAAKEVHGICMKSFIEPPNASMTFSTFIKRSKPIIMPVRPPIKPPIKASIKIIFTVCFLFIPTERMIASERFRSIKLIIKLLKTPNMQMTSDIIPKPLNIPSILLFSSMVSSSICFIDLTQGYLFLNFS
ncbi:hypothetical protein SDC9_212443 [bioreactor metagenome]|uniref:Uncharacterized protein n=1 Tax=bioreactor metagenome TaxID=1076179 RepID=A0A645JMV1_9ZZZZ